MTSYSGVSTTLLRTRQRFQESRTCRAVYIPGSRQTAIINALRVIVCRDMHSHTTHFPPFSLVPSFLVLTNPALSNALHSAA